MSLKLYVGNFLRRRPTHWGRSRFLSLPSWYSGTFLEPLPGIKVLRSLRGPFIQKTSFFQGCMRPDDAMHARPTVDEVCVEI